MGPFSHRAYAFLATVASVLRAGERNFAMVFAEWQPIDGSLAPSPSWWGGRPPCEARLTRAPQHDSLARKRSARQCRAESHPTNLDIGEAARGCPLARGTLARPPRLHELRRCAEEGVVMGRLRRYHQTAVRELRSLTPRGPQPIGRHGHTLAREL